MPKYRTSKYGRERSCTTCHREIPDDQSVCLATEACLDRHVERCCTVASMRNMHDADPEAFRNMILQNHQQKGTTAMAPKADTKTTTPREKKVKAPTFCRFTGLPTGGGLFQPGRDASLKGVLNRMAVDGDVDALVELLCYAWPLKDGIDPAVEKAARAELKDLDRKAYTEERAALRIKQLQNGSTLESVYGEYLKPKPKPKAAKAPAAKATATKATAKKASAKKATAKK